MSNVLISIVRVPKVFGFAWFCRKNGASPSRRLRKGVAVAAVPGPHAAQASLVDRRFPRSLRQ